MSWILQITILPMMRNFHMLLIFTILKTLQTCQNVLLGPISCFTWIDNAAGWVWIYGNLPCFSRARFPSTVSPMTPSVSIATIFRAWSWPWTRSKTVLMNVWNWPQISLGCWWATFPKNLISPVKISNTSYYVIQILQAFVDKAINAKSLGREVAWGIRHESE